MHCSEIALHTSVGKLKAWVKYDSVYAFRREPSAHEVK